MIAQSASASVRSPYTRGFTLLELLVVIAIAAILVALAAPSLRDIIVRNKMSALGNEFIGSLQRARNEAVSKNTCVTICMSTTTDAIGTGTNGPVCETTGSDWKVGWIAFLDPTCANTSFPDAPENMLFVRKGDAGDYRLLVNGENYIQSIEFGARGLNGLNNARQFNVQFKDGVNSETSRFGFNICLSALGRTLTIPSGTTCS